MSVARLAKAGSARGWVSLLRISANSPIAMPLDDNLATALATSKRTAKNGSALRASSILLSALRDPIFASSDPAHTRRNTFSALVKVVFKMSSPGLKSSLWRTLFFGSIRTSNGFALRPVNTATARFTVRPFWMKLTVCDCFVSPPSPSLTTISISTSMSNSPIFLAVLSCVCCSVTTALPFSPLYSRDALKCGYPLPYNQESKNFVRFRPDESSRHFRKSSVSAVRPA
mmetsp:Transcript_13365/g.21924  ORF Transcript_13365/g.21924 Transcript_13365/m.21924 type:complete len:229 (+) Transcript_13365:1067-1753(+)